MAKVNVVINGRPISVAAGSSVAAALALAGVTATRRSITGAARAPVCGIGVCYECRVTINGQAHRLSCQVACAEGMQVVTDAAL